MFLLAVSNSADMEKKNFVCITFSFYKYMKNSF